MVSFHLEKAINQKMFTLAGLRNVKVTQIAYFIKYEVPAQSRIVAVNIYLISRYQRARGF